MLVVLIPVSFAFCWLLAYQYDRDGRIAALIAWTTAGTLVVASTELLSPFHGITRWAVVMVWVVFGAITGGALLHRWRIKVLAFPQWTQTRPTWTEAALLLIAAVAVVCAFLSGFCSPPNNWDSMTYKLPRVHYWIQHQGVHSFPTYITRQVELAPGAGYWLLHVELLSHGFRWFFSLQWVAGIMASIAASLIVRELGGGRTAQVMAACLIWSIPIAILQASSTQDDLTAGSWVLTFSVFAIRLMRSQDARTMYGWGVMSGCALGVGMLTKGTAQIFALPLCVWVGLHWLRAPSRPMFRALLVLSLIVISLNAPFLFRNATSFGHPFGGPQRDWITNGRHSPIVVYENLLRNLAVNFATLDHSHNKRLERRTMAAIEFLGGDPRSTDSTFPWSHFYLKNRFEQPGWLWHEDWAPNPFSTAATILAAGAICLIFNAERRAFAIATLLGGVVFCWAFRYQPWITRLQLPFFLLGSVSVALLSARWPRLMGVGAICLLLLGFPAGPLNFLRPLSGERNVFTTGRDAELFAHRPDWRPLYERLHGQLVGLQPTSVGIIEDRESWEWPVMYYFHTRQEQAPWFGHPFVESRRRDPEGEKQYDAIVLIDHDLFELPVELTRDYVEVYRDGKLALWRRNQASRVPSSASGESSR